MEPVESNSVSSVIGKLSTVLLCGNACAVLKDSVCDIRMIIIKCQRHKN